MLYDSYFILLGLPDSTQKDETSRKQVNTGHSTVHDTYRAILRQLEALLELFKKLVSKESPTSGMSSNNTNMEHEYKATTAELASTTEVTAGNSDNQLNQLTHRTTLGSERQAVLSRVDDDGSGDESLLDVFEAKTEETLQESNVSKENIDEILAEDEVFNAMKKSQNSKSEVSTLKPSETDVSKSAKSHREGTSGMKYVEKEEPGKITTQPTEDHKMIPTSEKYVLEEIKEDEYTSTEKVTEQKFMNKFEDDGESLTPNVEDLIKRYKGTDEYTEGTSTEPMERSYEGTDPPFDTSDLMSQAIDEDTVGYTNTDPTTKTTINEYLRLLLHAIRPTKIPRKVKEEIFLPRGEQPLAFATTLFIPGSYKSQ